MIHNIKIAKAGTTAQVNDEDFSDEVLGKIIEAGISALLNAKMSKIGPVSKLEGAAKAQEQSKAMAIAEENLALLKSGKYKFAGSSKAKSATKGKETTEAVRLAREYVRDQIRLQGITVSHVSAADITAAAKSMVESDSSWLDKARESLAKRDEATKSVHIDLASLGIRPDPGKVAKAEAGKAKARENLSAAQAGKTAKVAGKAKPVAPKMTPAEALATIASKPAPHGHTPLH